MAVRVELAGPELGLGFLAVQEEGEEMGVIVLTEKALVATAVMVELAIKVPMVVQGEKVALEEVGSLPVEVVEKVVMGALEPLVVTVEPVAPEVMPLS